jgi:hypothetical protein
MREIISKCEEGYLSDAWGAVGVVWWDGARQIDIGHIGVLGDDFSWKSLVRSAPGAIARH